MQKKNPLLKYLLVVLAVFTFVSVYRTSNVIGGCNNNCIGIEVTLSCNGRCSHLCLGYLTNICTGPLPASWMNIAYFIYENWLVLPIFAITGILVYMFWREAKVQNSNGR